jgi:hypothetical protein
VVDFDIMAESYRRASYLASASALISAYSCAVAMS